MPAQQNKPDWWDWEPELVDHLLEQGKKRGYTETDIRAMLADATDFCRNHEPGRWQVHVRKDKVLWEIIVEPDYSRQVLEVITAYSLE